MENKLPPLPGSDEKALKYNQYNGFYKIGARSFWGQNSIERIEDKPAQKCDHYFFETERGVRCKKCHFGLIGRIKVQEGKLFLGKEQFPL